MFRRFNENGGTKVRIEIDGTPFAARSTDSVAAALLAAGVQTCRATPVSGQPRAPYCMMGVCFECLVVVDGIGSRQGCMIRVREGMRIETQNGKRELGH